MQILKLQPNHILIFDIVG